MIIPINFLLLIFFQQEIYEVPKEEGFLMKSRSVQFEKIPEFISIRAQYLVASERIKRRIQKKFA